MNDDLILDANSGGGGEPREQHPTGTVIGVCVDVINLGERVESFQNGPEKLSPKVAFVFQTGKKDKEGRLFDLSKEYTFSGGDKASLRKDLGAWRGAPFTEQEIKQGLNLRSFIGKPCQLTISEQVSKKGTTYSKITGIAPLMEQLLPHVPQLPDYTRPEFWGKRIEEYKDQAAEFKRKQALARPVANVSGPAPVLTNEQVMEKMVKAEQSEQDGLPPF